MEKMEKDKSRYTQERSARSWALTYSTNLFIFEEVLEVKVSVPFSFYPALDTKVKRSLDERNENKEEPTDWFCRNSCWISIQGSSSLSWHPRHLQENEKPRMGQWIGQLLRRL